MNTTLEGTGSPRDFYEALHRAFDATLQQNGAPPARIDALLTQAFDSFAGNLAMQCEGEAPLACKRGCASCCVLRVTATAPEVFLVARFLAAVSPRLLKRGIDLIGQVRTADLRSRGLAEPERLCLRQPCPFVAQGVCVIYDVRPLACRGHASHDVRACVDAVAGRRESVPYSAGHRLLRSLVQSAMQSALRDAGLAWQAYELNHAVVLALADPQAHEAWLAGADSLAAAAVQEVPLEEMASVFDRLRPAPLPGC